MANSKNKSDVKNNEIYINDSDKPIEQDILQNKTSFQKYRNEMPILVVIIKIIGIITAITGIVLFGYSLYELIYKGTNILKIVVYDILFVFSIIAGLDLTRLHNLGRILLLGLLIIGIAVNTIDLYNTVDELSISAQSLNPEIVSSIYNKIYIYLGIITGAIVLIIFFLFKPVKRLFP